MKFAKIFKLGQKGAKRAKKARGGAAPVSAWPEGTRVGVFGHENSGKTVFFTALYTQSKTTNNFHISVRDNATANEFFRNDMAIKGVDVDSGGTGTIAAKSVPKKFPDHTVKDVLLQFTAILDGSKKIPVVTYDYNGKAASISEHSDEAEKIRSFMAEADGLLFFFDPKILGADPEVQARVSSFVNILELIVSLKSRLPVPVGLVITKADSLPGYNGEEKTILIRAEDEQVIAEDYESFLEKVLGFDSLADDREWASSVRAILVKLREFIRVVVGRTLDFQIFFVSSTGNKPEKIGAEVGRSIYAPPDKVNPCGVTVPFHWILNSIVRSRRLNVLRRVAGFVVAVSIAWIVLCSLPFIIHFGILFRSPQRVEDKVAKEMRENGPRMSDQQKERIAAAYARYGGAWLFDIMFSEYRDQAERMKKAYRYSESGSGPDATLDAIINRLTGVIADEKAQPKYDNVRKKLKIDDVNKAILDDLRGMHSGNKEEATYARSERVLYLWGLYTRYLGNQTDVMRDSILTQVDESAKNADFRESERRFGEALLTIVGTPSSESGQTMESVDAVLNEYNEIKSKIGGKDATPDYVLGEAVQKLEEIKARMRPALYGPQLSAINAFLAEAKGWENKRQYKFRVQSIPDDGHIHFEVTKAGVSPRWSAKGDQVLPATNIELDWQPGDEIHIAFDEAGYCQWGKSPSDEIVLAEEYALFQMDGPVILNKGTRIQFKSVGFKGGLKEELPKLK
jgi:hypothetical protein